MKNKIVRYRFAIIEVVHVGGTIKMTDGCTIACLQQSAQAAAPAISGGLMTMLGSLGGGSLIGFTAGYFLKKMIKVAMIVMGAFALGLMYLGYNGMFTVNWNKTEAMVKDSAEKAVQEVTKVVQHTADSFNDGTGMMGNEVVVGAAVFGFVPSFLLGVKKG